MNQIIKKNYGSIPHLSTSKLEQQADKKISMNQELMLTKQARDWRDLIIVTEKIDGSNVGIVKINGTLYPISRKGYDTSISKQEQHRLFSKFVDNNLSKFLWLPEGWRICGEWCVMAHGTIYDITDESPFVAFDIFNDENERLVYLSFRDICTNYLIPSVPLLHIGQPISLKNALKLSGKGLYGKPNKPEGIVYRIERNGKVDFLAKWVRHDKEDGKYMKDNIWNKGYNYVK